MNTKVKLDVAPSGDICLPSGDYTLLEGQAWFECRGLQIHIHSNAAGVAVDIYPASDPAGDIGNPVARAFAYSPYIGDDEE